MTGAQGVHEESLRVENLRRGDIWFVKMGRMDGSGLRKIMPCVVIQIDEMNTSGAMETAVIAPLTNNVPAEDETTPYDVIIEPQDTGLPKRVAVVWTQIRALSPDLMMKRTGRINGESMKKIADNIAMLVGKLPERFD